MRWVQTIFCACRHSHHGMTENKETNNAVTKKMWWTNGKRHTTVRLLHCARIMWLAQNTHTHLGEAYLINFCEWMNESLLPLFSLLLLRFFLRLVFHVIVNIALRCCSLFVGFLLMAFTQSPFNHPLSILCYQNEKITRPVILRHIPYAKRTPRHTHKAHTCLP